MQWRDQVEDPTAALMKPANNAAARAFISRNGRSSPRRQQPASMGASKWTFTTNIGLGALSAGFSFSAELALLRPDVRTTGAVNTARPLLHADERRRPIRCTSERVLEDVNQNGSRVVRGSVLALLLFGSLLRLRSLVARHCWRPV